MTDKTAANDNSRTDIFTRPSEFRQSTVLTVWEKGKPVEGKPGHRYDWRNGSIVGPWQPGEPRNGVWDVGHIEPWYRVVDRLKKVDGITREMVLDEFNNLDNLGVEDPEANRRLGVNSRKQGRERLSYEDEEKTLFEHVAPEKREELQRSFRRQISTKAASVNSRIQGYRKQIMQKQGVQPAESEAFSPPQRVIVWDTETTGLSPKNGDKIVEIGAIELVDGKPSGRKFHQYINPERKIPARATEVHGITDEMVKDKPPFRDIVDDFLDFIGDAPLVAHNASFDMRFINAELADVGQEPLHDARKIDTLRVARSLLPDLPNHNLDTLAKHFGIDTSGRDEFHGGMVDTLILAEVYLELAKLAQAQQVDMFEVSSSQKSRNRHRAPLLEQEQEDVVFEREWQAQRAAARAGKAPHGQDAASAGFAERVLGERADARVAQR